MFIVSLIGISLPGSPLARGLLDGLCSLHRSHMDSAVGPGSENPARAGPSVTPLAGHSETTRTRRGFYGLVQVVLANDRVGVTVAVELAGAHGVLGPAGLAARRLLGRAELQGVRWAGVSTPDAGHRVTACHGGAGGDNERSHQDDLDGGDAKTTVVRTHGPAAFSGVFRTGRCGQLMAL